VTHEHDHGLAAAPRRILVPVDGDRPAGEAFGLAAALAEGLDAELVLLGVEPALLAEAPTAALVAAEESSDRLHRRRVLEARDRLPAGMRSRAVFGAAPAGPAIVDAAREEEADLVVVPMRRGGELAHVLHDGADRHVLRHSPVPVLVVPEA
jgi:nucleotide-binding universal stress UspA family protein